MLCLLGHVRSIVSKITTWKPRHNCPLRPALFAWVCGTTATVLFYHDNGTLTVTQELCLSVMGPLLVACFGGLPSFWLSHASSRYGLKWCLNRMPSGAESWIPSGRYEMHMLQVWCNVMLTRIM
ncbi:hypothetical protein BDR05DRAFT_444830 [Suillus weaverae]|nr:hypothetical protein BDR05DRAFT_444830 [Suillus weaverae]